MFLLLLVVPGRQPGGGRRRAHEALLQRVLHRRPQAAGKDRGLHLRPLPGDQREARQEHRRGVERHGGGGEDDVIATVEHWVFCLLPGVLIQRLRRS